MHMGSFASIKDRTYSVPCTRHARHGGGGGVIDQDESNPGANGARVFDSTRRHTPGAHGSAWVKANASVRCIDLMLNDVESPPPLHFSPETPRGQGCHGSMNRPASHVLRSSAGSSLRQLGWTVVPPYCCCCCSAGMLNQAKVTVSATACVIPR
jgi:hypothetical protein